MASVRLEGVEKVFPDGTAAVRDIDLEAADGEFLVLVGPSGSGKSTILRMVAGLEAPTAGRILIGDRDVTGLEPGERDVAMVFQSYALYPHRTVRQNLAFGLRMRKEAPERIRGRVAEVAELLDIGELLDRRPARLSGGQRQRVALGRAIVREPRAFLLDEPLSNLDPALRGRTREELARLHRRLGATILHVTHDQEEAMTLGGRVAVLRAGRIEQVAAPMTLYRRPATRFVGEFIGSPPMNVVRSRTGRRDGEVTLAGGGLELALPVGQVPEAAVTGGEVDLGVRPHDVVPTAEPGGRGAGEAGAAGTSGGRSGAAAPTVRGRVALVEPRGADAVVRLALAGPPAGREAGALTLVVAADAAVREGDLLDATLPPDRLHFFDPATGARLEPGPGGVAR